MKTITPKFAAEFAGLLAKHKIKDISVADAVGQALEQVPGCHLGNSVPWVLGGMFASYARRHDVFGTLKSMVEKLGDVPLNYNDLDCDMWGKRIRVMNPCIECDSLISKLQNTRPEGECPRCHDTKIDPSFFEEGWFLVWDNHGNGLAYALWESSISIELHIRKLSYNARRHTRVHTLERLVSEVPKDRYDTDFALIRYRDSRDEGFLLSLVQDKDRDLDSKLKAHHECEAELGAQYALSCIVEHFPCVIDDELSDGGRKPL